MSPCGVDAGEVRLGGFSGQDIALGVQLYLPLEKGCLRNAADGGEEPLAWQLLPPAGGPVLQGQGFQLFSAGQTGQERPRVEDDVGAGRQGLLLPGFRAHVFLPEDHMDLAAQPGQAPGGGGSSVATSQHGYVLVSKEHAIAGGAVGQAPAQEALRLRKGELPGAAPMARTTAPAV